MTTTENKNLCEYRPIGFHCDRALWAQVETYRHDARHKTLRAAIEGLLLAGLQAWAREHETQGDDRYEIRNEANGS